LPDERGSGVWTTIKVAAVAAAGVIGFGSGSLFTRFGEFVDVD
jgi:hypothetical protein